MNPVRNNNHNFNQEPDLQRQTSNGVNLFSLSFIKNLLKKYGIKPSRGLGQNFLIDKGVVKKVIEAAELSSEDIVLEIGPGLGNLTQELTKRVGSVIAVEKDEKMVEILRENLKDFKNLEIIQGDILKSEVPSLKSQRYKIVANLPFYLTAPVIRKFLEIENPPKEMVLMVQKEVGQKICAKPPKMSILAVSVQFYAMPKIIAYISKKSFWPQPKVDSTIIKISNLKTQNLKLNKDLFFKIVKAGFSHPRKQLINNLSGGLKLDKEKIKNWLWENNIQSNQRAETLNVEEWIKLTESFTI